MLFCLQIWKFLQPTLTSLSIGQGNTALHSPPSAHFTLKNQNSTKTKTVQKTSLQTIKPVQVESNLASLVLSEHGKSFELSHKQSCELTKASL